MKTGPSDNPYHQRGDDKLKKEENELSEAEKKKKEGSEKDREFEEEAEELEEMRKEREERKKKQKEELEKKDRERKGPVKKKIVKIGGQEVERKVFDHDKGKKGIFDRRGKVKSYQRKIDKAIETKVQGIPSKKKKGIADFIKRGIERKGEAKKKEIDVILDGIARKDFSRTVFKKTFEELKKEGVDLEIYKKELKKINRRDIGKVRRALEGGDSRKHKIRPDSNRTPNRPVKAGSNSPSARVGKIF